MPAFFLSHSGGVKLSTSSAVNNTRINIAIDGPAGAGKSTVARRVAQLFDYVYIDTGAMYRAITLAAIQSGVQAEPDLQLERLTKETEIRLEPGNPVQRVYVNGQDVTEAIRSREVTSLVSQISAVPMVREILVDKQRLLAARKGIVMDGRDIGTHVLPDAELKVFLTASVEQRALRRYEESGREQGITLAELEREIEERDRKDSEREVSPLVQAHDAVLVDTTKLPIEEVVAKIVELARAVLSEANKR